MNNDFLLPIRTALIRNGNLIARELNSSSEEFRRWIAIFKFKPETSRVKSDLQVKTDWLYKVFDFEFRKSIIEGGYDYFSEDVVNQKEVHYNSETELIEGLEEMQIDLSKFNYPWKCDYPL